MKKTFSLAWVRSTQPRKQRKYRHNAPLHVKRKFLAAHLADDLRKELGRRNAPVVKGDTVKIMRGDHTGKKGEVTKTDITKERIYVKDIKAKKANGTEVQVPFRSSNVEIVTLNRKDPRRISRLKKEIGKKKARQEETGTAKK